MFKRFLEEVANRAREAQEQNRLEKERREEAIRQLEAEAVVTTRQPLPPEREGPSLEFNARAVAEAAQARGRYELAAKLMQEYAVWYKAWVVGNPMPFNTAEDSEKFQDYLEEYETAPHKFAQAAIDRDAVVSYVKQAKDPLSRQEIEAACPIHTDMKYGIFLNQLVRGDWLNVTGDGKDRRYTVSSAKRQTDAAFLRDEKNKQRGEQG